MTCFRTIIKQKKPHAYDVALCLLHAFLSSWLKSINQFSWKPVLKEKSWEEKQSFANIYETHFSQTAGKRMHFLWLLKCDNLSLNYFIIRCYQHGFPLFHHIFCTSLETLHVGCLLARNSGNETIPPSPGSPRVTLLNIGHMSAWKE